MKSQRIADALEWLAYKLVRLARCIEELSDKVEPRAPFKPMTIAEAQREMNEAYSRLLEHATADMRRITGIKAVSVAPMTSITLTAAEARRRFWSKQGATTNSQQD